MRRVRELPPEVVAMISAGEVIERPSSCMKELLENSIDAEATRIEIGLRDGGKSLITVLDNGSGIMSGDIDLILRRHTTSKIENLDDINRIKTMGFRGEALPSIGAVSKLEIFSRNEDEDMGAFIKMVGGEVIDKGVHQRQVGTTVNVKELFFNLPARKKFLHSERAEYQMCIGEVIRCAIPYPEISFLMRHNGKNTLRLRSGTLEERVMELYGKEFLNGMIYIEDKNNLIHLYGWVSQPNESVFPYQMIFVNKRSVWHRGIVKVVSNKYNFPASEKPGFIMFIEIFPEEIDVNVHPSKKEVRFHKEGNLLYFISEVLDEHLKNYVGNIFDIKELKQSEFLVQENRVWQFKNKYILAQIKKGLLIIDQHAAHERILYDRLRNRNEFQSQQLLFPLNINLSPLEMNVLESVLSYLKEMGFVIKVFSGNTIVVNAIPSVLVNFTEGTIQEIIQDIISSNKKRLYKYEETLKSVACKSAIKAGDKLSEEEIISLIEDLFSTTSPYTCPHGRPTFIEIPIEEIDRRFLR